MKHFSVLENRFEIESRSFVSVVLCERRAFFAFWLTASVHVVPGVGAMQSEFYLCCNEIKGIF